MPTVLFSLTALLFESNALRCTRASVALPARSASTAAAPRAPCRVTNSRCTPRLTRSSASNVTLRVRATNSWSFTRKPYTCTSALSYVYPDSVPILMTPRLPSFAFTSLPFARARLLVLLSLLRAATSVPTRARCKSTSSRTSSRRTSSTNSASATSASFRARASSTCRRISACSTPARSQADQQGQTMNSHLIRPHANISQKDKMTERDAGCKQGHVIYE